MKKKLSLICFIFVTGFLIGLPICSLINNIENQNIATGFFFLSQEAGFEISESILDYNSYMNYGRALMAGVINTIYVATIGNILAFGLGIILGVFSLSKNILVSRFCSIYLNFFRNIPLLLQLFFWYGLFTDIMPSVKKAKTIFGVIISNRGISFPIFDSSWAAILLFLSLFLSICVTYFIRQSLKKSRLRAKGIVSFAVFFVIQLGLVKLITFIFNLDYPVVRGFNVRGGVSFSPEFISLLLGLTLYTAAFMGEIVRSGIQAVDKGQWEAAYALGMNRIQTLKKIILPQSFKVALPPMTAQFLNLTKNSSLAVAIGYPDFVSIANTTMNQTGQAVELVLLIMGLYLFTSLSVSGISNLINRKLLGESR